MDIVVMVLCARCTKYSQIGNNNSEHEMTARE
jgi:hypothetical protein